MTLRSVLDRSVATIDGSRPTRPDVLTMAPKPTLGGSCPLELIDTPELARRLGVPKSWVAAHTRGRTLDRIPCLRFGKYVRFAWGSPELTQWLLDHQEQG
jgi:hypothetical protein